MDLQVERRDGEEVPVLAVHGELDLEGAPGLRLALIEAIDENPGRQVVVDLEGVDFIDSAGLGVLTRVFEIHPSRSAALGVGE